jgi:hypothetical protein
MLMLGLTFWLSLILTLTTTVSGILPIGVAVSIVVTSLLCTDPTEDRGTIAPHILNSVLMMAYSFVYSILLPFLPFLVRLVKPK